MRALPRNRCDQGVRDCCAEEESHFCHVARTVSSANDQKCPSGLSSALGCLCTAAMDRSAAETMKSKLKWTTLAAGTAMLVFARLWEGASVSVYTSPIIFLKGAAVEGVYAPPGTIRSASLRFTTRQRGNAISCIAARSNRWRSIPCCKLQQLPRPRRPQRRHQPRRQRHRPTRRSASARNAGERRARGPCPATSRWATTSAIMATGRESRAPSPEEPTLD